LFEYLTSSHLRWIVRLISLIILLFSYLAVFAVKPSSRTVQGIEGFESTFYSDATGLPYLSLEYKTASSQKPKVGFLTFGVSFLKISHLKIHLDLGQAPPNRLLSMWQNLMTQKAIRYATMEPVHLDLADRDGKLFMVKASKGKFTSSGELRMWGQVLCTGVQGINEFERLSIVYDARLNALTLVRGSNDFNPMLLTFKHS